MLLIFWSNWRHCSKLQPYDTQTGSVLFLGPQYSRKGANALAAAYHCLPITVEVTMADLIPLD
jgi:hypothetical protein